jgi:putative inorganic carbon (HCO3(-)) transporter
MSSDRSSAFESKASWPGAFWERSYVPILLCLWVLIPEARRLVDWQIGYNALPVIILVPIVALLPLLGLCLDRNRAPISHALRFAACLWAVAFAYSFLVGWLSGSLFGAMYEATLFGLPLLVALWLGAFDQQAALQIFERFSGTALWLGAATSAYAIYQFVAPPPWDVLWVINSGLVSIGKPEPFSLRVFGTMNAPAVFADFLVLTILLNLHRLRIRKVWLFLPVLLCSAGLALTLVRTAWLELALGFLVYLIFSPRRATPIVAAGLTAAVTLCLAWNLSLVTGNAASNTLLVDRIMTLNDVNSDVSASARLQESTGALRASLAEPLGQGLGTIGTATKLSAAGATTVLDNGYLMRFFEMGVFGMACYLLSLLSALCFTLTKLRESYSVGGEAATNLLVTSLAIQVGLLGAELSGDHHSAFMAIVFWGVVGLGSTINKNASDSPRFGAPVQHSGATFFARGA